MRKDNEKGFFLIDLLVAIAILSIVATGAGMTAVQVIQVTQHTGDHSTAVRQAQNMGLWISQDLLMARSANTTDDAGTPDVEFIIVAWKDWETGDMHEARYVWANPADSAKRVLRKKTVSDRDGVPVSNTTTLVANNIYSVNLSLQPDSTRELGVETRSGKKTVAREYEIARRVE